MAEKIQTITQEDLIRLEAESDEFSIEVDDGAIVKVENNMTWLHVLIMRNLFELLVASVRVNNLGWVMPEGVRFILDGDSEDIQRAYKPDLSYVRTGRITNDYDWSGDFEGAPDLAVEIAEHGQKIPYFMKRIGDYFDAGVADVWVIYPTHKKVYQCHHTSDAPRMYYENDYITTPLFSDLQIHVAALFKKET